MISIYINLTRICILDGYAEENLKRYLPKFKTVKSEHPDNGTSYTMMENIMFSPGGGVKIDLQRSCVVCVK